MSDIKRESLLQCLQLARPAIANQNFVPALSHFAFDGWGVTAYNDLAAIGIKTDADLGLCLPADMLVKALNSMSSENVNIEPTSDDAVNIKAGKSKMKIPFLPLDKHPFEWPSAKKLHAFEIDDDVLQGIAKCMVGVGTDPNHANQLGVTLDPVSPAVLYATDNVTMSRYVTKQKDLKLPGDAPIVIPTFFCQQLIALGKAFPKEVIQLYVGSGVLLANFGEQAMLFNRTLADIDPIDFEDKFKKFLGSGSEFKDIPPTFEGALERSSLILGSELDKVMEVSVEDGKVTFFTSTQNGEAEDTMKFEHEDIAAFHVNPNLILRASKSCSTIAFRKNAVALAEGKFTHLIAHSAVK